MDSTEVQFIKDNLEAWPGPTVKKTFALFLITLRRIKGVEVHLQVRILNVGTGQMNNDLHA
jgi:hypothetical protein